MHEALSSRATVKAYANMALQIGKAEREHAAQGLRGRRL